MNFKDLPIQRKVTLVIMLTCISALLIAGCMFLIIKVNSFRAELVEEMSSVAALIGASSQAALEFDDRKAAEETLAVLKEDRRVVRAALYDINGEIFATFADPQAGKRSSGTTPGDLSSQYILVNRAISLNDRKIGEISLTVDAMLGLYASLYEFATVSGLALLMSAVAAYIISRRLQRVVSDPIVRLAETAKKVSAEKDYSLRAEKTSNDEIGLLIDRFNEMLEQIRKQNASLRDSDNQIRLITDSLPILISYVSEEQVYRFVNKAYEQWFNIPRSRVIGRTVHEVLGEESYRKLQPHIENALTGRTVSYEAPLSHASLGERYALSVLVPDIEAESGRVRGYFAMIKDITERKKAEDTLRIMNDELEKRVTKRTEELRQSQEKLRHSERLASIGTLAAGMAHEIRNPINSISLASHHALRYQKDIAPMTHRTLEAIASEAGRCGTIIKNILLFAKSEKTAKSPQNINELVNKAIILAKSYSTDKKVEFITDYDPDPGTVNVNPTEIEQVIVNILNNAIEAARDNVLIEIRTRKIGDRFRLSISDNGPGIPEGILGQIFDPFFSTKRRQGNTGLGLSLCHGIISEHGASVSVNSIVGTGSTFTIDFTV